MSAAEQRNAVDEPTSALSLLDYASLSMGLELLPHRALELFRSFGLDGLTGPRAMGSWETWLKNRPRESAECAQMRGRMRAYWVRWDAQTPLPQAPKVPEEGFAPRTSEIRVVQQRLELSVMELASMSMALELFPARRDEILVTFGARTENARRDAARALAEVLASSHLDVTQWQTMRTRMRAHWTRWDEATPRQGPPRPKFRPRKSYQPPARFRPPPTEASTPPSESAVVPQPSVLTLLDYVRLSLALERVSPDRAEALYRQAGLDRATGDQEVLAWKRRLADCDEERTRFHRLRDELLAASAPMRAPAQPPISLFEYSVLCVELDLDPTNGEEIHRRLGLVDAPSRERAHAYWQGRFEVDEAARAEWFSHVERLRRSTPARR
jgi:hypothetical protein